MNNNSDDECSEKKGYCGNGTCLNTIYGRHCDCEGGFENQDQQSKLPCQDINECDYVDCGHGICYNEVGSFRCECDYGYFNLFNSTDSKCGKHHIFKYFTYL